MTGCLETGSHLCHGCVTDASRPSPGETPLSVPRPPLVPGRRPAYPPSRTASQPLPARPCVTRCAAYRLSAPVPNLSGAVAFQRLPAGRTILERMIDRRPPPQKTPPHAAMTRPVRTRGGHEPVSGSSGAGPDRCPRRGGISQTVEGATLTPSFVSSPWIRRCPHRGFSLASRTTRRAMLRTVGGRPSARCVLVSYFFAASLRC